MSPRASQVLVAAARAWALIASRDHVVIDDVHAVLPSVVQHLDADVRPMQELPSALRFWSVECLPISPKSSLIETKKPSVLAKLPSAT